MAAKTIDWRKVRSLYEDHNTPRSQAAALAGMSPQKLSQHAKAKGWKLRTVARKPAEKASVAKRAAAKLPAVKKPRELVKRVYATIDGELSKLEKQTGVTSQDRERASRALSQMVGSLEKAIHMQRDMSKRQAKGGAKTDKEALAHAEDIRREIAERLARLRRQRRSERSE